MIDYKILLGSIAVVISVVSYIPYFRDIFRRTTKPHAFSWLVWSILTAIAFFGQYVDRGGPGAWVTGVTAVISFCIFILALWHGSKDFPVSDKMSLGGAGIALLLWYVTDDPLLAVLLITVIDMFGFYPTFRKSYVKPREETLLTFFLGGLKFVISLFALQHYSVVTVLYPASLVLTNFTFVAMLTIRRRT